MKMDMSNTLDSFKEGVKEGTELLHVKTSEFHENYVSKVMPDCGIYGDAAKFVAEMAPGVSEYNAIKDGDWEAFAVAAGIDVTALAIGAVTAGTGYAALKGGTSVAKAGVKAAAREIAESGTKKVVKEVAESGGKKVIKETVEAGTEKVVKEAAEVGTEKVLKEVAEAGTEKLVKETVENGGEKAVKETAENSIEKTVSQIEKNKHDGLCREKKVWKELVEKYGENNVMREVILRDANGNWIKDSVTGEARRIDFVVIKGKEVMESWEVTSRTAPKGSQIEKEKRILEQAKELGGAFIKETHTGELIRFGEHISTVIRRVD